MPAQGVNRRPFLRSRKINNQAGEYFPAKSLSDLSLGTGLAGGGSTTPPPRLSALELLAKAADQAPPGAIETGQKAAPGVGAGPKPLS